MALRHFAAVGDGISLRLPWGARPMHEGRATVDFTFAEQDVHVLLGTTESRHQAQSYDQNTTCAGIEQSRVFTPNFLFGYGQYTDLPNTTLLEVAVPGNCACDKYPCADNLKLP